jgi:hypothetical protein
VEIIGTGPLGTRSSVLRLRRKGSALEFVVFPMVHVAAPRFYAEVAERLRRCDVLVVEGVADRSVLTWALTASYRVIPKNRRSGLVVDNIPYAELGVPLVRPDVSSAELGRGWRTLPLYLRLAVWCVLPVVVVLQLLGGRRWLLAPSAAVSDDDLPASASEERLAGVLGGERDRRLLATLTQLHEARSGERIDVAVVYGAAHVAPLVEGLLVTLGYRARSGEWLTVLDP